MMLRGRGRSEQHEKARLAVKQLLKNVKNVTKSAWSWLWKNNHYWIVAAVVELILISGMGAAIIGIGLKCLHATHTITLTMYYGSEKQEWVDEATKAYNNRAMGACDNPVVVEATPIGSGESMQEILDGTIQPDIWWPAGMAWVDLINQQWQIKTGKTFANPQSDDVKSMITSPVVIAMWKPEAEALGWSADPTQNRPIGWADIATLSSQGWAAYNHPEFGQFTFGHTNPHESNSGLDALIGETLAGAGNPKVLGSNDITNPDTRNYVSNIETSIIHYGESTGFFATEMFKDGPSYLSAAVLYESLVAESYNTSKYPHIDKDCPDLHPCPAGKFPPVVAIYPKEGTFYSDHPLVAPQAGWVTDEKRKEALAFRQFLLDTPQQQIALQDGFRPVNHVKIGAPIDSAHGVDPSQPKSVLQVPPVDLVTAIQSSWDTRRRNGDVMLIVDRSGSMNDTLDGVSKLSAAKAALQEFVDKWGATEGLGLTVFSDQAQVLIPITPLGPLGPPPSMERVAVSSAIQAITAQGDTLLYDTIDQQVQALAQMPSQHIKAIVLLTDGQDTISSLSLEQLLSDIGNQGIRVYTIAYGPDADVDVLKSIALVTHGIEYNASTTDIEKVYEDISQSF